MDGLFNFIQGPAFKWVILILLLAGGSMFLIGLRKLGLGMNTASSPLRGFRFLALFGRGAVSLVTILAIFVLAIISHAEAAADMGSQVFSSFLTGFVFQQFEQLRRLIENLGPASDFIDPGILVDAAEIKSKADLEPEILFYYIFLAVLMNLIVILIQTILDKLGELHFAFWWLVQCVTIVVATFIFVLSKDAYESSHPVDQINDFRFGIYLIVLLLIAIVLLLVSILMPEGGLLDFINDLLIALPMAIAVTAFSVLFACLFILFGGLTFLVKAEQFFSGPLKLQYSAAYAGLALLFIFLWYFVWLIFRNS